MFVRDRRGAAVRSRLLQSIAVLSFHLNRAGGEIRAWFVFAAASAVVVAVAGCGSGTSTYDQERFGACVATYGATMSHLQGGVKPGTPHASAFSEHLPYAGMANFLDSIDGTTVGEFVYFYAPADIAHARDAATWLESRGEYSVSRSGNLVVATDPHPSASLRQMIGKCKKQASTS